jgi:hypothetical protein
VSTALEPLWAIEQELTALLDSIETCPAELQPELQTRIAEYLAREAAKIDQTAHVLAALDYEQKTASDEIARLAERKRAAKAAQDRLEAYLCRIIAARGGRKLIGNTNTLSVRPSDAVLIVDEAAIPAFYIVEEVITTKRVDKAGIKKALKAGREVPGADLEYHDNLVRK